MDDLQFGTRNRRGDWAPNQHLELAPFWARPLSLRKIVGWTIGYVWPWNAIALGTAWLWWHFIVPDMTTMETIGWAWVLKLLVANWIGIFLFFGYFELRYYRRRVQERRFKYNGRFPAEQPSDVFWFHSQNIDNFVRSLFVSVPIGTAIEVGLLWAFANGLAPTVGWREHRVYLVALTLLAPIVHEVHFYFVHRAIHWGPLYKWVHSVHHNSVNPSPWSSLSMHPVESAVYFGVALWALAVPSHPFLAVYFFHLAGFGAVVGHLGFDRLEMADGIAPKSHAYAHYLHHKFFEVNYCDNGTFPLDKWFGSWHDGSPEGDRRMQERFNRKKERVNAT
ncbi:MULTISPECIES: sterol desaturase family protein [Burkholderia]|uniref:sterol desaturase family protein n=1 Tax=Burkholderia TaxID=32008 RepID=UPI00097C39FE|nr:MULTISPECIES: sterol desaturase family protein [Burkholderia]AQQ20427.1 C-5 sterol desaturase [Burkholderia cenocepacia]MBJ9914165.1 sterol desaturase family protein [Burkholderia cenocepacia]MBR8120045.1 sterol desaturase family protein [Burkholderia cenocepacia]MBR8370132.1 sterol desaturase family protein [Burkholderia cenocepacia]MBR8441004.1 sterol desaturase family protein [Burkholderia cenocepacia]